MFHQKIHPRIQVVREETVAPDPRAVQERVVVVGEAAVVAAVADQARS